MSAIPPLGNQQAPSNFNDVRPIISLAVSPNYRSTVCSLDADSSCFSRILTFLCSIPNWIASLFRATSITDSPLSVKLADVTKHTNTVFFNELISKIKTNQCKVALVLDYNGRTVAHTVDIENRDPQALRALQLKGEETLKSQINADPNNLSSPLKAKLIIAERAQNGFCTFSLTAENQSIVQQNEGEGKTARECAGWVIAHFRNLPEPSKREVAQFFRPMIIA